MDINFSEACKSGELETVKTWIASGGDVDARDGDEEQGPIGLHNAALYGHYAVVKILLENGVNFEKVYEDDYTVLALAIDNLDVEIVEILLMYGANPHREVGCHSCRVSTYQLIHVPIYSSADDKRKKDLIVGLLDEAVKTPRKSHEELMFEESKRLRQERLKQEELELLAQRDRECVKRERLKYLAKLQEERAKEDAEFEKRVKEERAKKKGFLSGILNLFRSN